MASSIIPLIMLLILCLFYGTEAESLLNYHEVHIYSDLPKNTRPLVAHCFSGDDDFGNHTLYLGQEFYWTFRSGLFGTRFFCHFWWGSKQQGFEVFNSGWIITKEITNYVAKADGLYFNYDPNDHKKDLQFKKPWA